MHRKYIPFLTNWFKSSHRLPLVIRGARQVGKTWLVRHFAKLQGLTLIELNFEANNELVSLFKSNDPSRIIQNIETFLNIRKINPAQSLLFLDEIQVAPALYAKLRWFAENMPELPVIAAGSLLEFIFNKQNEPMSMPVGRVAYMYIEPLSFEEFLQGINKPMLADFLQRFTWNDELPEVIHNELTYYFKEYLIVGGMPAAVSVWSSTRSLQEVSNIQQNIISSFIGDFHKYAGRLNPDIIEKTMKHIPFNLGKKFVYSKVTQETQGPTLKKALELLIKARICYQVISTDANGIPLEAEKNEKFIKVVFLDVGLCMAGLKLSLHDVQEVAEINLINSGGIAEQIVAQLLRTIEPPFIDPQLFYWLRPTADAEIDYVIQHRSLVVPIEVKAGKAGSLKSLHYFMSIKKRSLAIRIYSGKPIESDKIQMKDLKDQPVLYTLRSIPFYLIGQLHRLCD